MVCSQDHLPQLPQTLFSTLHTFRIRLLFKVPYPQSIGVATPSRPVLDDHPCMRAMFCYINITLLVNMDLFRLLPALELVVTLSARVKLSTTSAWNYGS